MNEKMGVFNIIEHMMNEKIGIFLRARMGSSRLPGKHMLQIMGKPVIQHLVERVKFNTNISQIVLCITENQEDDILEDIAKENDLYVHRGKSGAVLQQFVDAAKALDITKIVSVDCDNLLFDYTLLDKTAQVLMFIEPEADYIRWRGYPVGAGNPKGMSLKGLETVSANHKEGIEHIFAYMEQEPGLTRANINMDTPLLARAKPYINDIRLTLDYKEDLELFRLLFEKIHRLDGLMSFESVMNYIHMNQWVLNINKHMMNAYKEHQNEALAIHGKTRGED